MADEVWQVVLHGDSGQGWSWRAIGRDGRAIVASETIHATQEAAELQARGLFPSAQIVGASGPYSEATPSPTTASPTPYPRAAALAEESGRQADPIADVQLASWGRRAVALMLDSVVLVIILVVLFAIAALSDPSFDDAAAESAGDDDLTAGWIIFLLGVFFGPFLYTWLMLGAWGQTLGKMALGIRVARAENAQRIGYPRALGRTASVWLLSILYLPIILSYLWPLWDSRNQTLQDKMASTIVVRV